MITRDPDGELRETPETKGRLTREGRARYMAEARALAQQILAEAADDVVRANSAPDLARLVLRLTEAP